MKSSTKYYQIERSQIAFFKFILEAYEGIAVLSTVDSFRGVVVLRIPPGCESETEMLVNVLEREIMIEPVEAAFAEALNKSQSDTSGSPSATCLPVVS